MCYCCRQKSDSDRYLFTFVEFLLIAVTKGFWQFTNFPLHCFLYFCLICNTVLYCFRNSSILFVLQTFFLFFYYICDGKRSSVTSSFWSSHWFCYAQTSRHLMRVQFVFDGSQVCLYMLSYDRSMCYLRSYYSGVNTILVLGLNPMFPRRWVYVRVVFAFVNVLICWFQFVIKYT